MKFLHTIAAAALPPHSGGKALAHSTQNHPRQLVGRNHQPHRCSARLGEFSRRSRPTHPLPVLQRKLGRLVVQTAQTTGRQISTVEPVSRVDRND
jgi:hypothetical protein